MVLRTLLAIGFHDQVQSAPTTMAITVQGPLWSKSFDRLKATHSEKFYPNGKHCGGGCRSSTFSI